MDSWDTPHQHHINVPNAPTRDLIAVKGVVHGHVVDAWLTVEEHAKLPKPKTAVDPVDE